MMNTMGHHHYQEILREILSSQNFKHINIVVFEGSHDVTIQKIKFKKTCRKRCLGIKEPHLQQKKNVYSTEDTNLSYPY
jgi:hypothetical protein